MSHFTNKGLLSRSLWVVSNRSHQASKLTQPSAIAERASMRSRPHKTATVSLALASALAGRSVAAAADEGAWRLVPKGSQKMALNGESAPDAYGFRHRP